MQGILKKVRKVFYVYGLRPSTWGILLRIMLKCLRYSVAGTRSLNFVEFAVTYRCNACCAFCSSSRKVIYDDASAGELTTDEVKQALAGMRRLGATAVAFSGGEPMLRRDLDELIAYAGKLGINPAISTNGSLLTCESIDRMRRAGLRYICCSLHGVGEVHDRVVGIPGTYQRIMEQLAYAQECGLRAGATITLTRESIAYFPELARITNERDILLGYNYAIPVGLWGGREDVLLGPEEQAVIESVRARYDNVTNDYDSHFLYRTCPAGTLSIYLSAFGDVLPCPFIQVSYGNLRRESLEAIYRRMSSAEYFRENHRGCVAGQHLDFVRDVIRPIYDAGTVPLPVEQHPCKRLRA